MTWADTQKAQSTLWTPERVEKLKELWAAGWSASECAAATRRMLEMSK